MERFLTWRVLLIGTLVLLGGAWLLQRVELVGGGPALAAGALPALPLLLLAVLAALRERLGLGRGELLALYLMVAIGLPLAASGWAYVLLPGLTTGQYFFADEKGRYYPFLKLIPEWMVPGQSGSRVVGDFFEGGAAVPWGAWVGPLLWWSLLVLAFAAASLGLAGLLRQRWLEEERLRYPLAEVPLELSAAGFWHQPLAWAGLLVPVFIYGINGIHHYFLFPGELPLSFDLGEVLVNEPWSALAPATARFVFSCSPLLVGLCYLLSVEVSFSTWFFFLLTRLQLLGAYALGRSEDHGPFVGLGGQWREWPNTFPHLTAQARGGLLCVALLSLWAARHSLARACQRGLGSAGEERWALALLAGGMVVLVGWGWAAGLTLWLSGLHCLLLLLTVLGMARLRLDGGLPATGLYFLTGNLFFFAWGSGPGAFAPAEYVALAFLSALSFSGIGAVALLQFEGLKLAEAVKARQAQLWLVLGAGLVLGLVAGYCGVLQLVYERGLFILDQQGGGRGAARIGRYFHYLYAEAGAQTAPADGDRLGALGFGFAATALLAWLRQFFLRSPFHPLGFVYGTGLGGLIWGSALVGWALKALVVRYGGALAYRRLRPFFLGLIGGELFMRLVWALVALWGQPGGGFDW